MFGYALVACVLKAVTEFTLLNRIFLYFPSMIFCSGYYSPKDFPKQMGISNLLKK